MTTLQKKSGLDNSSQTNDRPVSNLFVVSKLLQCVVWSRMIEHVKKYQFVPPTHQSACRKGHSVETALTRVLSDFICYLDKGELNLLELLAAFDTVDYTVLLTRFMPKSYDGMKDHAICLGFNHISPTGPKQSSLTVRHLLVSIYDMVYHKG